MSITASRGLGLAPRAANRLDSGGSSSSGSGSVKRARGSHARLKPHLPMKKTTQFKQLLQSDRLEFLLEAHNGISARIGQEAGFKGLWASGLCMSGQCAVRDSNEASWTQVL